MQVLGALRTEGITMVRKRGHGVGDGVVKQAIESVKFVDRDWRTDFDCQLGDGLADSP
jgi:hypothetical protein